MSQKDNKSPLVLLSGLLCDSFMWEAVTEQLSDIADIYTFSFAGFNSLAEMADKVLSDSPEHFALVGHSMGGRVALEVFRKAPERVTRLALLNTGAHPRSEAEVPNRQRLLDMSVNQGMEAVADDWLPPMMSPQGLKNPQLINELRAMILRHTADDFNGEIQALLNRPNAEEVLPSINVPTLLLSGSADAWSPISQHREMQQQIPGSQLVGLEGVGHMSTVEAPDQVADALRGWLLN